MSLPLRNLDDIRAIEATPLSNRGAADNLFTLFAEAAAKFGERTALRYLHHADVDCPGVELSHKQLFRAILQFANALQTLGVGPNDAVALLLPNLPQTHIALWGASLAGIATPINPLLSESHITELLTAVEAKVLVTVGPSGRFELWEKAVAVQAKVPGLKTVITVDPGQFDPSDKAGDTGELIPFDFDTLLAAQSDDRLLEPRQWQRDTIAAYFHTGGTTGKPSVAPLSHGNICHMAAVMKLMFDFGTDDVILCGLPLFHVNAVFITGIVPFHAGATVLLATPEGYRNKQLLPNFWSLIEHHRISFFSGVPTIYSALLELPADGFDLSSLRYGLCGAAPMPAALMQQLEAKTGLKILEGYGMTEGSCASTGNPRDGLRKAGSIGLAMPYTQVKVAQFDEAGNRQRDCETNEVGRLLIKGPNLFQGYLDAAKNAGKWTADGWFDTGDLGRCDSDGYFWLVGRSKDLIIRGGHNIDPQPIEEGMATHPAVDLVAAVGQPDEYAGELPVVFVTLKNNAQVDEAELLRYAKTVVNEPPAVPKRAIILEQMPLTAVGKIFKPALRGDAARRIFSERLQPLGIGDHAIEVKPDDRYGLLASINIPAEVAPEPVKQRLDAFSITYELQTVSDDCPAEVN